MTATLEPTSVATGAWVGVCPATDLVDDRGVCALVGGRQVAIFRTSPGELFAVDNADPFSGANVMSRGIVGSRGGVPKVASPMYKQSFDLRTGLCLDDPSVALPVYLVRERAGRIEVAVP
ncbi:MAG TPA: nitrite reductase small subunit NirD [Acidimicrobiales bacterium]|jgi:nitrite reductase (NADH) small subunit|nr:nitrite reductase small subunit NirD [Acidimicrobiales bacterium]